MRRPLFPFTRTLRVAILMSGSGSVAKSILESKYNDGVHYQVVCILTDKPDSNAKTLAKQFNVPYEENDLATFYQSKKKPKHDLSVRNEFDAISVKKLEAHNPDVLAFAGYMAVASPPLVNAFLGVNVHPADLGIKKPDGSRKYVGSHAVRDAILAGEKQLRSTTHIVSTQVDGGPILMRSLPVKVRLPKSFDPSDKKQLDEVVKKHQQRLKEHGDWIIFPHTLAYIAANRLELDEFGQVYCDDQLVVDGLTARPEWDLTP